MILFSLPGRYLLVGHGLAVLVQDVEPPVAAQGPPQFLATGIAGVGGLLGWRKKKKAKAIAA